MSTPVPTPMITPAMFDLDLLHDVERLEKALLDRQIERDAEYAHVINNEEYEETEQGLVCSCCDGAQSFELSAQCCDGHIFCKDCLVSYVTQSVHGSLTVNQSQSAASDSAISSGAVTCFSTSGCQSLIPVSELSRLLPKPLLQSHLDATAQRSLIDAGLDVARCPFCSYFEAVSAHPTGIWDNINGVRFSIVIAAAVLVLLMCLALVGMVVVYSPILWASSGVASQVSVIAVPLFDFGVIGLVIGATWFFGSGRRHAWIRLQARAKYLAGAKARAASRAPPRYHLDGPTPFDISTVSEGSGPVSWLQWLQCALSFTSSGYLCSAVSTSPISPGDSSSSSTSSSPSTMQDGKTLEAEDESNGALFHCKNPSCCRTSCMLCDRMFSAGHRCIDDGVDALRLHIERTMTEIVKRTCPQCGLSFVRSSGCNKMTCRCGYVMCYLCRQDIKQESYQHYCQHFRETPGTKCTECAKCELYGTIDEDAQIRAAAEQAREEFMLKWGTQMSVKTQKQQFHRTMALQNRTAVADAFVQQHVIGSNGNATLGERIDMAIESTIDPILTFILS
ncbi:hypothetical protein GQ42DRAFT_152926 [Ramicandelaber brevisporus]|nr:hypothetical protein GQ42DRAFT_152926 [Ramicandelaber brevisporus]